MCVNNSFQKIITSLQSFWIDQGCVLLQPYDLEVGAGTFHPATVLRVLGPEPIWKAAYVQPCRRPTDGRYGENPNRLQHYYQFQVIIQPSPEDIQNLYLESLKFIGLNPKDHDIRFVEDDWESPTLGASGLGWEIWCDGMEISQFTYFQQVGGIEVKPVASEITYGLERLAMFIQKIENVYDLDWDGIKINTKLDKNKFKDISLEQVKNLLVNPICLKLSDEASIRNGKYGKYIYYKTDKMKRPKFIKLSKSLKNNCTVEQASRFLKNNHNIELNL